uniref:NADH-ubiquinone oxidoreductase chain 6 n=1 Tax=Onthophagus nr. babirussa TaxID=1848769 RepID=A0A1X9HEM5_9SCAR|nr:NADH deshydrogenase subunit 6 [Onthophagus nr. babirussa]
MLIMLMTITLSMMIMWIKHPLTMGMILLIQTINLSLFMGYLNLNYWYSYILFLIMIGGMLVLFIYMTSVASNEKFSPSIKLFMFLMFMLFIYLSLIMIDPFYMSINNNYMEIKHNLSLNKYFNFPNLTIMFMLIMYLLVSLLIIVKITSFKKGSLRSNFSNSSTS